MRGIIILIGISLLCFSAGIAQETDACVPASGDPIRLGAIFPQGALLMASAGQPYEGAQAMLEAINACGGVNGRPVEWVYQPADSRVQAEQALSTLVESENVPLVVGGGSAAVSDGLESLSDTYPIVFWEVTEALSGTGEWAFSPRPTLRQLGVSTATFAETVVQDRLNGAPLRPAIVYEDTPRGQQLAAGIRASLHVEPVGLYGYKDDSGDEYELAVQFREADVNVMMVGAFNSDADWLWFAMRAADANVDAWIQVGSADYRKGLCGRLENDESILSISPTGPASDRYYEQALGPIYQQYRQTYVRKFSMPPGERANLSASGVYMLLHHVLPTVEGDYTPENIRAALLQTAITSPAGLMGEGLMIDTQTGVNQYPGVFVLQRQYGAFCTLWPDALATCASPLVVFPTWRERALSSERFSCSEPM